VDARRFKSFSAMFDKSWYLFLARDQNAPGFNRCYYKRISKIPDFNLYSCKVFNPSSLNVYSKTCSTVSTWDLLLLSWLNYNPW